MSWIIKCPEHGKMEFEYHADASKVLAKHGKEKGTPEEMCLLFEDPEF